MATPDVPFIVDLARAPASDDGLAAEVSEKTSFRRNWKEYVGRVLPHHERGVRNFMLTCLAEGRAGDDDDENNKAPGPPVVCNLSIDGVREALSLSDALPEDAKENYVSKLEMDTAKRAVELTRLNAGSSASDMALKGSVCKKYIDVPIQEKKTEDPTLDKLLSWTAAKSLGAWERIYERWRADVFDNPETLTPTEEQAEVLRVVHERVLKEEYELAGERPPTSHGHTTTASRDVTRPLLQLVHGLPGSGKSKLVIANLKRYFEEVWQWTRNKQYALVAPMNTMADNIGGSTMHSFGRIPFKDRRGTLIQSTGDSKSAAMFGSPGDWHELRFLLIDEVEAAGCGVLGRLEENLRL